MCCGIDEFLLAQDSLQPPNDGCSDADCGFEGVRTAVIAGCYAPPILEPAEHVFDLMALFIQGFIIGNLVFSVLPGGNAGGDPLFLQAAPEPIRVIATVSNKGLGGGELTQQLPGSRIVRYLARRQVQQNGPALAIAYRMQL